MITKKEKPKKKERKKYNENKEYLFLKNKIEKFKDDIFYQIIIVQLIKF
jgi:hypothetical protein